MYSYFTRLYSFSQRFNDNKKNPQLLTVAGFESPQIVVFSLPRIKGATGTPNLELRLGETSRFTESVGVYLALQNPQNPQNPTKPHHCISGMD